MTTLQNMLKARGFAPAPSETARCFFGPGTRRALQELQQQIGLPATGDLDLRSSEVIGWAVQSPDPSKADSPAIPSSEPDMLASEVTRRPLEPSAERAVKSQMVSLDAAVFMHLAAANPLGTVISNLSSGSPMVRDALDEVLNAALRAFLSAALIGAALPRLAEAAMQMPNVDIAASSEVSIRDFVRRRLVPRLVQNPSIPQATDLALAKLSSKSTIGNLLQLDTPLRDHSLWGAAPGVAGI